MIDAAIRSILLANSAVYSLVGTRIYPIQLPLTCKFPAISYLKPSDPYDRIVGKPRMQIDCWGEDFTEVQNLKNAVETALDGYSGIRGGVNIEKIVPLNSQDIYENETKLYHVTYDFFIIYRK